MEEQDSSQAEKSNIEKIIDIASLDNLRSVDLSGMSLTGLPSSLLSLHQLEHLYFEGNLIQHLPCEFFIKLGNLLWLDLRNNKLEDLPSCIGAHKKLKTLLLGGNNIQHIPPELGQIQSLNGLNLVDNPLVDPPPDVVELGVFQVKAYLLKKLGFEDGKFPITNCDSDSDISFTEEGGDIFDTENKTRLTIKTGKKDKVDIHYTSTNMSINAHINSTVQLSLDEYKLQSSANSAIGPSWFIHRPWTTGVYFTRPVLN